MVNGAADAGCRAVYARTLTWCARCWLQGTHAQTNTHMHTDASCRAVLPFPLLCLRGADNAIRVHWCACVCLFVRVWYPRGERVEQDAMGEGALAGGAHRPLMDQRLVVRMPGEGAGDLDPGAELEATRRDRREAG